MASILVEIMPDGKDSRRHACKARCFLLSRVTQVTALDTRYAGHGVIEAYISLDDAAAIAKLNGVGSVILQLKPIHSVGAVTDFGVNQHRVNRIDTLYNANSVANYDGTGMTIGVMSDSFDSQPSMEGGTTTATVDVGTNDLPGTGNLTNSTPVFVLQDYNPTGGATNEGRGMCQIVADMAPKARIGFATADSGELGFRRQHPRPRRDQQHHLPGGIDARLQGGRDLRRRVLSRRAILSGRHHRPGCH